MGILNIRSLLLAAFVVFDCITWSWSRHHFTHNINGHRSRHRRQGAGLFLSASYVLPGGEGSGPWGEWGEVSPCSRTCGGGVASQKRICLGVGSDGQPQCTGGDTKFISCQTQDCPDNAQDFRTEQCAEFNDKRFRGNIYEWVPYTKAPNPCELNCMPRGERFYFRQKAKVTDGTRCNDESFDVCVDGRCQPVGCDMMLGSNAREDKCRQCRGNGTNCHTISGVLDSQELRKGYNDVMLIPQGATNIFIAEVRPSENYLALRAKQDNVYYLNGDYHIDFPRSLVIAGALWHYERSQQGYAAPDKLRCIGPTTEPLYLSLLLQDVNVGIEYEYSVPTALAPPPNQQYIWVHEEFSPCNATCGGGYQTRQVSCRTRDDLQPVDDNLCEENFKPPTNQTCNTDACGPQWVEGDWSPCSKPCGEGGTRSRQVHCQKIIASRATLRFPSVVADKECFDLLGPKPELYQECNQNETCPTWFTGPWKPCDKLCGAGKQTRQVVCHQRIQGRVTVFDDSECAEEKPTAEQPCILHPCDGVDWVISEWSGCDSCLSTYRTRQAQCATKDHRIVDSNLCSYHPTPALREPCDKTKLPACEVQWYATQWSKCSVECGEGVQSRRVFCGLFDGASVLKVDDSRCSNISRYNDTRTCEVPKEKCPARWFAGPWSECTKECGGGEQYRRVMCLNAGKEVKGCDEETILDSTQSCNIGPCNEDDMLPVDAKSTPIMDDYDYEECEDEEEESEEVGAEALSTGSTVFEDLMFSDSPSTDIEGSGGSTFTSDETETETDMTETETATDSSTFESTGTDTSTVADTSSTESTSTDGSTVSGITDAASETDTLSTEATEATVTDGSTTPASTDGSSESTTADITYISGSTTESGSTSETSQGTDTSESSEPTISITEETVTSQSTELSSEGTTETTDSSGSTASEITDSSGSTTEVTETSSASTEMSGSTTEITETSSASTEISGSTTEVTETSSASTEMSGSTTEVTETSSASTEMSGSSTEVTETSSASTELSGSTTEETVTSSDVSESSGSTTEAGLTSETTELSGSTTDGLSSTSETTESSSSTETSSISDITETSGSTQETGTSSDTTESSGPTTERTESTSETGSSIDLSTPESTETGVTSESPMTSESSSTTEETGTDESTVSGGSTPWDWSSTVEVYTKKPRCKPRKKAKCIKSKFGCCPDKRTPAAGPFDEGCPNPKTCKESKFGCCPDGVSAASGAHNEDCPVAPCNETLFGCCRSDNVTAAAGNDQEGCPPPVPACKLSKYGCCADGKTKAKGSKKEGCPEEDKKVAPSDVGDCTKSKYGCCYDNETDASGPDGEGCPCSISEFGCCPDGVSTAVGAMMEGCVLSCNTSAYGCCSDGETPAHGPQHEGCCLQYAYGCCPDNYKPAEGPHLEGCGCQYAHFGCCPDNVTIARGPSNEGCGCKHTQFGCCPDRHTPADGPEFKGCGCHTYQFGCCDDGVTTASGPDQQGCRCQQTAHGCCGDGTTAAKGPNMEGCDCSNSKYGCCPDGITEAKGEKFYNCTDKPENRQAACALANDRGSCRNYTVHWFYDMTYGGCSRFWYGGCEGNGNRFSSQEECEDVCVQPPPQDACNLPMVKGACSGYHVRWYYDSTREQCSQFVFGGCLGNANNFNTKELCQQQCEPEKTEDQCNLSIERGPCAGSFQRWGYNSETRSCSQFTYGGCGGNPNRFGTEAACLQRCNPPGAPQKGCTLAQDVGNCTEKIPAWSFSPTENRCVPFYYSGCGGNGNRYDSELECSSACPSAYVQEVCTLPALTGECADYTQRWFFDTTKNRCRQFYYGGCGGNENNFRSEYECENRCSEQQTAITTTTAATAQGSVYKSEYCFLERDPGPCNRLETRWSYDEVTGACSQFQYGGCGGNMNNFPTAEHCQYYCGAAKDACQLPMAAGPCYESLVRWFYDAATDSCSQFAYGGCEGNDNRFDSLQQCENRCRTGGAQAANPTTTVAYQPPEENLGSQCQIAPTLEECQDAGVVWYLDDSQQACVSHNNPSYGLACRHTGVFSSEEACERACGAFRELEVCRYPLDAGPCTSSVPKVYFDLASGRCEQFLYSGCHGGPNRFSTMEECEQICRPKTNPCEQQPEPGNCLGSLEVWYYDERRDECSMFIYGGCNGNDNRFETREECEGRCKKMTAPTTTLATPVVPTTVVPVADPKCQTPRSLAPCGANETIYYFDTRTQACVAGDFGGCGYLNSYRTEEECERNCGAFVGLEVCGSPLDPGPCVSSIPKVYFEVSTGRCLTFMYGGCHGGPNRFSTVEECEGVCSGSRLEAACLLPVQTGRSCGLSARRWYYSTTSVDCLAFVYSGCDGNENNFRTYEECSSRCKMAASDDSRYNEVLPDCEEYEAECASIRCEYGVQRTRTSSGCERCACVAVEVDCAPLRSECDRLKCTYGIEKITGDDGCERCRCIDHPCSNQRCPAGQRCVAAVSRDLTTGERRYTTDCRIENKAGECPADEPRALADNQCRRECNDDADCTGVSKCCARGCSQLCLQPAGDSSPSPLITSLVPRLTTYAPELPQAPRATLGTEPEVTANEGDKATLRCLFHGNPPPKISWRRGEITIDGDVGRYRLLTDGTLEIVSVYRNDSGVYICIADNDLGRATQEIRLEVNDPVEGPAGIAGVPNMVVTGDLGQPLNIRCLAYGYPTPQIYWYRGNNGPMVPYSNALYEARGNILQIRRLNSETLGEYLCQAYNGRGKAAAWPLVVQARSLGGDDDRPHTTSRDMEVNVTPRPVQTEASTPPAPEIRLPVYTVPVSTRMVATTPRVTAGGEINLPCEVDGYPVPDVYWTKDGARIVATDRIQVTDARLVVSLANTNDSGVYGCHASNAYSSHYSTVQITVEGFYLPPTCKDNPYFADCNLIVRSKFCYHKYYSNFCCKSCVEAGLLNPIDIGLQADQPWYKRK